MSLLRNCIRLSPLQLSELPFHTEFESSGTKSLKDPNKNLSAPTNEGPNDSYSSDPHSLLNGEERPELALFLREILDQAVQFINDIVPTTFREVGLKTSNPSAAKVRLLHRDISSTELREIPWSTSKISRQQASSDLDAGESWFARVSQHENSAKAGTACFEEFDWGLRVDHSEHERDYTPDIINSFKVLDWDLETGVDGLKIDQYSHVKMNVYEMAHKLPFPLSPRVFPVLVITAKTGSTSFIVVQIPVELGSCHKAFYSNGRNLKSGDSAAKRKSATIGVYTSVECCKILENQKIEWSMATASDAKGSLPMRVQKLGVPTAIAKDVGFFIKWTSERRAPPGLES